MIRGEKVNMKSNESILILGKNHLFKFLYKEELEDEGYISVFADDDKDALRKIKEFSPYLFITNYQIASSEETFIEMLRHINKKEHIPIIINTAYPREIIDAESREVAECLTKSADFKVLKNKIAVSLHAHSS